jgi:hypothetical protein
MTLGLEFQILTSQKKKGCWAADSWAAQGSAQSGIRDLKQCEPARPMIRYRQALQWGADHGPADIRGRLRSTHLPPRKVAALVRSNLDSGMSNGGRLGPVASSRVAPMPSHRRRNGWSPLGFLSRVPRCLFMRHRGSKPPWSGARRSYPSHASGRSPISAHTSVIPRAVLRPRSTGLFCVLAVLLAVAASGLVHAASIAFVQRNYATPQTPVAVVSVAFTAAQSTGNLNVVVVGWNDTTATGVWGVA